MALVGETHKPQIDPSAVLAPGAIVIGQVTIGPDCFIGPNAVLRGDIEPIVLERAVNVQDNCTIHTEKGHPATLKENVSMGHGAVVHGATIEPDALIGMNAVVLNGATVGAQSVIGALTLVPDGFTVPPRSLAVGIPCRVIKQDDRRISDMASANGKRYQRYREEHLSGMWKTVRGPFQDNGTFDNP